MPAPRENDPTLSRFVLSDPTGIEIDGVPYQEWLKAQQAATGAAPAKPAPSPKPACPPDHVAVTTPAAMTADAPAVTTTSWPDRVLKAAAAAGITSSSAALALRQAAESGWLTEVGDAVALVARATRALASGAGLSQAEAVSSALAAHFAAADADANGVRDERLPGSHVLVSIEHGSQMLVVVRPINGDGPERRVSVDVGALRDWPTFRAAVASASGGQVQPSADEAASIKGLPDRLAAPVPTSTGNGKIINKPDSSVVGMTDARLADWRTRTDAARRVDLLSRTDLGRAALPAVASSSTATREANDEAYRSNLRDSNPTAYLAHIESLAREQTRAKRLEMTPVGRAVLAAEKAEDAGRR
jgi:hypothetical protein